MSTQQQPTAEKSVQTQDAAGSTTLLVSNNSLIHAHTENTATEVANTLVSMATGRQRATTVKQLNVISVPAPPTLPILSLADYTTAHGVPTAMALASQAKLTPTKSDEMACDDDEDESMSTDDYQHSKSRTKSSRAKGTSKSSRQQAIEPIQYGPITVKPRQSNAPTLANGRKSKDTPLPPDEDHKRNQRRDRNKKAAAKCRRKRNDLREELEQRETELTNEQRNLERTVQSLSEQKTQLEILLHRFDRTKKGRLPVTTNATSHSMSKSIPAATLLDPNSNNKRVTINFTNAQDLLSVAPLSRIATTDGLLPSSSSSSAAPMITIHIVPEVAQALLGSTSFDKAKLVELIQQASMANSSSSITTATANTSDSSMTNSTS